MSGLSAGARPVVADKIEQLYQHYAVLADAAQDVHQHEKEYLEILAAVKGSDKEKRLASQFIAKFFSRFPALAEQAIDAQFDLCEDDDVAIRKQAIKDLPSLCKDNKEHTQRIADILAQLLQTDDPTELVVVNNSLVSIMRSDPKGALAGLFSQIHQGTDNEVVRERCIKFLASKVKQLGREVINKEAEDLIIAECRKVLEDVIAEEFEHIMDLLAWTKLGKTPLGRKELVALVAAQAVSVDDWQPQEPEYIERLIQCSAHALPLLSSQVDASQFIEFFCSHVLPRWDEIAAPADGEPDPKLELLKIFAEMTEFCGELDKPQEKIDVVYKVLLNYLPEAPLEADAEGKVGEAGEGGGGGGGAALPSLQFSHAECALFALHSLGRRAPDALSADAARLKALRLRLQYTARLTQGYIKKLKEVTQEKKGADANSEESKIKVAALKTTSNINSIIKDLFRSPPGFKSRVQLSFANRKHEKEEKPSRREEEKESQSSSFKRHKPITFDNGNDSSSPEKRQRSGERTEKKVYMPPSGKYSNKISGGGRYGEGGGGGRGGGAGGGGGRYRGVGGGGRRNGAPFRRRY